MLYLLPNKAFAFYLFLIFKEYCVPGIVTEASYMESHFVLYFNIPYHLHFKGVGTEMLTTLTEITPAVRVEPGVQVQANLLQSLWS